MTMGKWHISEAIIFGRRLSSKTLAARATERPLMSNIVSNVFGGAMIPVAGAVLIRSNGEIVGCVGVAGDPSPDNDDLAARAGIAVVAELTADPS